jgi:hypothetical protein
VLFDRRIFVPDSRRLPIATESPLSDPGTKIRGSWDGRERDAGGRQRPNAYATALYAGGQAQFARQFNDSLKCTTTRSSSPGMRHR